MITMSVGEGKLSKSGAQTGAKVPEFAVWENAGRRFEVSSTSGAVCALARLLVAEGIPDSAWETKGADGGRRLFGPSFHRLAKLTVSEGENRPHFVKYVERVFGDNEDGD